MVRPGAALYGVNPTPEADNPMQPVVELKARIVQTRSVERGESVGYGGTWTARRPTKLAIVSAGYADGYFRAAGANDGTRGAEVVVAGKRCPIAGRVSMDLIAIDVTDLPHNAARRGHMATLIGEGITVDELAHHFGTIGYEVLTSLGRRYARVYKGGATGGSPWHSASRLEPFRSDGIGTGLRFSFSRVFFTRTGIHFISEAFSLENALARFCYFFLVSMAFWQAAASLSRCLFRHATIRPPPGAVPAQYFL